MRIWADEPLTVSLLAHHGGLGEERHYDAGHRQLTRIVTDHGSTAPF